MLFFYILFIHYTYIHIYIYIYIYIYLNIVYENSIVIITHMKKTEIYNSFLFYIAAENINGIRISIADNDKLESIMLK